MALLGSRSHGLEGGLVVLSSVFLVVGLLWIGVRTDFLPCTLDCGETYEAYVGARNLDRFGWTATKGVQDFAASPTPAAHPTLYLHNPNLGLYALAGLFAVGVRDLHAQTPWLLGPFLLGLVYLFLAVRRISDSGLLAACCLVQAASCYLLVLLWAFDAVRVWAWLLTFGLVYHLAGWAAGGPRSRWHQLLAGGLLAASLGVDYPFALFAAALTGALVIFRVVPIRRRTAVVFVLLVLGGTVLLRQVQVAAAVGSAVWWTDFTATLARRLPLVSLVVTPPDPGLFAATHHLVVWPGGDGTFQPITWAWTLLQTYTAVLGFPLVGLGIAWAWAVTSRHRFAAPVQVGLRLSLAVGSALAVTFLVFGQYVVAFYGVFLMPLIVHWLVLLLGLVSYLLLTHWRATLRIQRVAVPVGLVLIVLFVGWRFGTEAQNIATLPPVGYPGRAALATLRGRSVATLWISSAPSAYTDEWAAGLRTMRWVVFPTRPIDFDLVEYDLFFERDRDNPIYRRPELIFVPRLHSPLLARRCTPLGGAVYAFADGCSSLALPTRRPVWRSGRDYVLYETRNLAPLAQTE